jgi:hypothetical protein
MIRLLSFITSAGLLLGVANANMCPEMDIQGNYTTTRTGQYLQISQLGCGQAILSAPFRGLTFDFDLEDGRLVPIPTAYLKFFKERIKTELLQSGKYKASIQKDKQGAFIKIEIFATVNIPNGSGGKVSADVSAEATISVRKYRAFDPSCGGTGKEKKALALWVGNLKILNVRGGTKSAARSGALDLAKNVPQVDGLSYSDTLVEN